LGRLLFNVTLFVVSFAWGRRAPLSFLRALGILIVPLLGAIVVEAFTGWSRYAPPPAMSAPSELHRWTGHGIVILAWLLLIAGIGGSLGCGSKHSRVLAGLSTLCAILAFGLCLLEAFTGYLLPDDPARWKEIGDETHTRFFVLHLIALPLLITTIAAVWLRIIVRQLRRLKRCQKPKMGSSE
jgi:hypothetical protein